MPRTVKCLLSRPASRHPGSIRGTRRQRSDDAGSLNERLCDEGEHAEREVEEQHEGAERPRRGLARGLSDHEQPGLDERADPNVAPNSAVGSST